MVNPDELIKEICDRYSKFNSYQDFGEVISELSSDLPPVRYAFKTFFKQPCFFSFQFVEEKSFISDNQARYYFGHDGDSAYSLIKNSGTLPQCERSDDLSDILAKGIGTTCGTVIAITGLLLQNLRFRRLFDFHKITLAEQTAEEDIGLLALVGTFPDGTYNTIFISEKSRLIVRIDKQMSNGLDRIIFKDTKINEVIPDDIFKIPK